MLSFRIVLSNVFYSRFFAYRRIVPSKSFVLLHTSSIREYDSHITCRTLCTNPSPDYNVLNNSITSKMNLTKQIVIRGRAATGYQEELINDFLTLHETATPEEWHELVKKLFNLEFGMISEINVDGKILDSCVLLSKLDLARSYLTYMKSQKKKFNGAVVTAYIKVCYACKDFMTEQDKTRMKQFTDFLQKRYAVADVLICEGIVKGLVLQRKIDEALDIVAKTENMCNLNIPTYSAVATCLVEMGQFDKAVSFMDHCLGNKNVLLDEVYLKWIEVFKFDKTKLEKLLEIFQLYDIKPTKLVCDHLIVTCQSLPSDEKLTGEFGTINNRGRCSVCKEMLQPLELDEVEFGELREIFLSNVVVAGDVFKNTTPFELDRFLKLVESQAPFDVVIDGLNVAYMIGTKMAPTVFVNMIQHVIAYFREQQMKVLLIGRHHMKKWPNLMDVLKDSECQYFLIHDMSEDDPFMLYATMYSGIHTNFVTRDLLRTEKFLLQSDKYASLFKRWQQAHQIFISYISPSGRVYTRSPLNFQMNVQRNYDGGWHIPYLEGGNTDEYGVHRQWLCLYTGPARGKVPSE